MTIDYTDAHTKNVKVQDKVYTSGTKFDWNDAHTKNVYIKNIGEMLEGSFEVIDGELYYVDKDGNKHLLEVPAGDTIQAVEWKSEDNTLNINTDTDSYSTIINTFSNRVTVNGIEDEYFIPLQVYTTSGSESGIDIRYSGIQNGGIELYLFDENKDKIGAIGFNTEGPYFEDVNGKQKLLTETSLNDTPLTGQTTADNIKISDTTQTDILNARQINGQFLNISSNTFLNETHLNGGKSDEDIAVSRGELQEEISAIDLSIDNLQEQLDNSSQNDRINYYLPDYNTITGFDGKSLGHEITNIVLALFDRYPDKQFIVNWTSRSNELLTNLCISEIGINTSGWQITIYYNGYGAVYPLKVEIVPNGATRYLVYYVDNHSNPDPTITSNWMTKFVDRTPIE